MKVVYIYCLKHPQTQEIRYVGKTTNIKRRLSQHIQDAKSYVSNRRTINWICNLLKSNLKPIIEIIEVCNENNWQEREIYWISFHKEKANLCNHHDGGLGCLGRKLTNKEKNRIREIGYKQSYFSEEEKVIIWKKIQKGDLFKDINLLYPKFSISSYNAIKNGGLWNHITGLKKPTRTQNKGKDNYKSRKVICSITNEIYQSARQAWINLYSKVYSYSYFKCMLSGHKPNKTTLSYI